MRGRTILKNFVCFLCSSPRSNNDNMPDSESSGLDTASGRRNSSPPVPLGVDNRCCFCLTLRTGSCIVAVVNALVNMLLFAW